MKVSPKIQASANFSSRPVRLARGGSECPFFKPSTSRLFPSLIMPRWLTSSSMLRQTNLMIPQYRGMSNGTNPVIKSEAGFPSFVSLWKWFGSLLTSLCRYLWGCIERKLSSLTLKYNVDGLQWRSLLYSFEEHYNITHMMYVCASTVRRPDIHVKFIG